MIDYLLLGLSIMIIFYIKQKNAIEKQFDIW